ncbi:MAG TPA: type II toxin-antitoxin system VapC family toxin [Geodermatophilus sp.]|nr:type II toxin-antitoxin system VapC family toxin [Geodermatophilus sp.]
MGARRRPGPHAREAVERASEVLVSTVSFAEIGVEVAIGKLTVPADLYRAVLAAGVRVLGLTPEHGLAVADLPLHHRDPFDRLLVAQARAERLTLVTADPGIRQYDVPVIDATT